MSDPPFSPVFGNHTDKLGGEVTPAEYAGAVLNFSKLPTGAGRYHEVGYLPSTQPAGKSCLQTRRERFLNAL